MLRSIRNKIIFAVLLLILLVQVISTALQSYQVRTIFNEEFVLGAENLAQSLFLDLTKRLSWGIVDENKSYVEKMTSDIRLFIQISQSQNFEPLMKSKKDLLQIQFVNFKGELIVNSTKTAAGFEHLNRSRNPDMKSDETLVKLALAKNIASAGESDKIHIFFPLMIKDYYAGGLVLTFSSARLNAAENQIYLTGAILVVVFMLISIILIALFVRSILTRPIHQMIELMNRLSNGELGERFEIKNRDEISEMGVSFNQLVESLQAVFDSIGNVMGAVEQGDLSRKITIDLKGDLDLIKSRVNQSVSMLSETIFSVKDTSRSVEQSARELSKSAEVLSTGTAKQAATLEEISSSIAEIENHSKQNAEDSNEARQITDETLELVTQGNSQMEEMQTAMNQINHTSQDVSKIIKVIDEIAFQTNLLALNAAVEAARAGKYGKGFAVVAEEVRNLAARSAEAAKDTSSLIESSMKQVEAGVEKANRTSTILKKIVSEVEKSNELVARIADASREQTDGVSEIYTGISQVNDSVQQNSAISEETASASDVLLNQSTSLQQEIQRFKLSQVNMDQQISVQPVKETVSQKLLP